MLCLLCNDKICIIFPYHYDRYCNYKLSIAILGVEEKKPDEVEQRMEEIDQEIEEMPDDLEDPVMWETETGKFLSDLLSVFIFEAQLSNAIFINYKSTPDFGSSKQGTNFYNIAMFVVFFLDPFAFEIILEIN